MSQVTTTGANAHTNIYTTSAAGLVMAEDEILTSGGASAPETFYFYLNDQLVGQVSNNPDTTNETYTGSVNDQTLVNGTGPFYHGSGSSTQTANFDQNYQAINAFGNGEQPAGSSFTVQNGDTLSTVWEANRRLDDVAQFTLQKLSLSCGHEAGSSTA